MRKRSKVTQRVKEEQRGKEGAWFKMNHMLLISPGNNAFLKKNNFFLINSFRKEDLGGCIQATRDEKRGA